MQVLITISGTVQGVFFRNFIRKNAVSLSIKGYVRNTKEGNVEVLAEGTEESIKKIIEKCRTGPEPAEVKNIKVNKIKTGEKFTDFTIKWTQ